MRVIPGLLSRGLPPCLHTTRVLSGQAESMRRRKQLPNSISVILVNLSVSLLDVLDVTFCSSMTLMDDSLGIPTGDGL